LSLCVFSNKHILLYQGGTLAQRKVVVTWLKGHGFMFWKTTSCVKKQGCVQYTIRMREL